MALVSKHTTCNGSPTVNTFTIDAAISYVKLVNRSTNDVYWTSATTQGTAADGVPTLNGNNTYFTIGNVASPASVHVVDFSGNQGLDHLIVSWVCAVTGSQVSIVAE